MLTFGRPMLSSVTEQKFWPLVISNLAHAETWLSKAELQSLMRQAKCIQQGASGPAL